MKRLIKLLIMFCLILIIFLIYLCAKNNKIRYVAIGDGLVSGINSYGGITYSYSDYYKEYLKENNKLFSYKKYSKDTYRIDDVLNSIKYKTNLKRDLRESDLVTISIGLNDFLDNAKSVDITNILEYKKDVDIVIKKTDKLLKEMRKYAKNKIYIIGYYNIIPFLFNTNSKDLDILFAYIDDKYNSLCDKYKCNYTSIYELFKKNSSFLVNSNSYYPTDNAYKAISDLLINSM